MFLFGRKCGKYDRPDCINSYEDLILIGHCFLPLTVVPKTAVKFIILSNLTLALNAIVAMSLLNMDGINFLLI